MRDGAGGPGPAGEAAAEGEEVPVPQALTGPRRERGMRPPAGEGPGLGHLAELAAGAVGLVWALVPLAAQLRFTLAEPAPHGAAAVARWLLLGLLAVPWLLAAGGFAAGARSRRFGATAPLLSGAAGLAAGALGPARALPPWPVLLLGLAVLLRARRVPAHPMAYLGVFGTGFVLAILGYVAWVTLLLTAPRP